MKRFALMICLTLFTLHGVDAQPNLNFKRVVVNWPTIELYFSVGCSGNPAYNMAKADFHLFENGTEVQDFTLWCPDPTSRCAISVALVFDASGSMAGAGNAAAKQAGHAFIDLMDGVLDEATIIWFNTQVHIAQQMTTLKPLLLNAVDGLPAGGGTALWDGAYAGIIESINNGINQCRAVIVMTDGQDSNSARVPAEVISLANRNFIRVFTIGLGPSVNATELAQVALLTGGRYYQTPNAAQMEAIYQEITTIIFQGFQECVITYERGCANGEMRTVDLQLHFCNGIDVKSKTYRAPMDSTTFSDLFFEIGDVAGSRNRQIIIPVDLVTPITQKNLCPLAVTFQYDTTYLDFESVQIPNGGLLDGVQLSATSEATGVRIEMQDSKVVSGPGKMYDLIFRTKNAPDSTRTDIVAENATLSDCCFNPRFDTGEVTLYEGPVITPEGPISFCEGDSVRLTATSGFFDYVWSSGEQTREITVRKAGIYTVSARNLAGQTITSGPVFVTVIPTPTPRLTVGDTLQLCPGGMFKLGIIDTSGIAQYAWSTGKSENTIEVSGPGQYHVTVTNAAGCTGRSDTLTVVSAPIEVKLSMSGVIERCANDSLFLDAGEYAQYLWSSGDTTRRIHVQQSGSYFVSVVNAAGCTGASDTAAVTIHPQPRPVIQPSGTTIFCAGDSVTLDAGAFLSYAWNTGATTRSIIVSTSGIYTVAVEDSNGCSAVSLPVTVSVEQQPRPQIIPEGPTNICAGDSVTLDAGADYASYLWSTSDTTRKISVHASGNYSVTVWTDAGCSGSSTDIKVRVDPVPATPVITRSGDALTTDSAEAYQWKRDGQPIAGGDQRGFVATETGSYTVTVSNQFGCTATSDPFLVDVLGVEAPVTVSAFHLYPDPNDGEINLVLHSSVPVKWDVHVTNLLGQRYYTHEASLPAAQVQHTVDLRSAPPGMYLLRVRAGDRSWTRRIIRR